MKKKKTGSKILWVIQLLVEALLLILLWRLDMLPMKYFAAVGILLVLTAVISRLMLGRKTGKWEKNAGKFKRGAGCVFSVIVTAACLLASHAVLRLDSTFDAITTNKVSTVVGVYVLTDDPAQNIEDAKDYTFSAMNAYDTEAVTNAVEKIEKDLGMTLTMKSYDTTLAMIDGLYSGEVGAIVMSESYLDVLESMDEYSDFSQRTRLLDTHIVEKKKEDTVVQTPVIKDPSRQPFLVYISGNDARRELLADGGSDVNILVAVNPEDKQILMVNTPRDYFVANPAGGGAKDKLTLCGLYGIENSMEAMSQLYGQPISYYAKINFAGFRTLVDALGGVTIYSDISFSTGAGQIYAGENHLNGTQALAFARERKNLIGGDNDRGKNQMKLIAAMIDQMSAGNLLTNYSQILSSLEGMFATSMPSSTISDLVKMQLSDMASWDILSYAVTGDNGHDKPYSQGGLYAYVMYPHEDEVAKAAELIGSVLSGQVLTSADLDS